jgi:hypothetical protein
VAVLTPAAVRAASQLPSLFIESSGTRTAVVTTSATAASRNLSPDIATSCYNTWAYPYASYSDIDVQVSQSAAGYGNHCNYANIPQSPNVSGVCQTNAQAQCSSVTWSRGHADSTWDYNNYGINSALAWSNFTVWKNGYVDEYVYCRGWVDTNGNKSPTAWCSL